MSCDACLTKVDGINHCVICLAAKGARAPSAPATAYSSGLPIASLLLFALAIWGLLEMRLP